MKSALNRKKLTLMTLVVALGVAVYLNWEYAKTGMSDYGITNRCLRTEQRVGHRADRSGAGCAGDGKRERQPAARRQKLWRGTTGLPLQRRGIGVLCDEARLTRTKTRDEALDTLQKSLKNAKITDEEKKALTEELSGIITSIAARR